MQTQYAMTQTNHLLLSAGLLVGFPSQICIFCYFSHNHQQCFGCDSWENRPRQDSWIWSSVVVEWRGSATTLTWILGGKIASSPTRLSKFLLLAWRPGLPHMMWTWRLQLDDLWDRWLCLTMKWVWPVRLLVCFCPLCVHMCGHLKVISRFLPFLHVCAGDELVRRIQRSSSFWVRSQWWAGELRFSEGLPFFSTVPVAFPQLWMGLSPQEVKFHLLTCLHVFAHWAPGKKNLNYATCMLILQYVQHLCIRFSSLGV